MAVGVLEHHLLGLQRLETTDIGRTLLLQPLRLRLQTVNRLTQMLVQVLQLIDLQVQHVDLHRVLVEIKLLGLHEFLSLLITRLHLCL
jgi:hypothetical protein